MAKIERPLNPGVMRHLIDIQTKTVVRDEHGGYSGSTWETSVTVWASIEPMGSDEMGSADIQDEYIQAKQAQAGNTLRVRIWHSPEVSNITPNSYRIMFGSREFEIKHVRNPFEEGELIEMIVREKL